MSKYITADYNISGQEVLNIPMTSNDIDAKTIREYLKALLVEVWTEGEGFSGKRPFGNSGWEVDVYNSLEAFGYDPNDYGTMNDAIFDAIEALN